MMNQNTVEQDIINEIDRLTAIVNASKIINSFKVDQVFFDLKGTSSGTAQHIHATNTNILRFNRVLASENREEFKYTVRHEVAHLVTFVLFPNACQSHGPEFKNVNRWLGGREAIKHQYSVKSVKRKITKFVYHCKCNIHFLVSRSHNNVKSGTVYRSRHCDAQLQHNGKTIKI